MRKVIAATVFTLFGTVGVIAAQPAGASPVHVASTCHSQHECPKQ